MRDSGRIKTFGSGPRTLERKIVRLAGNTRHSCGHQWKVAFVFVKCSRPPAFWVHLFFSIFMIFGVFSFSFSKFSWRKEEEGEVRSLLSQHLPPCGREFSSNFLSLSALTLIGVYIMEDEVQTIHWIPTVFALWWHKCNIWSTRKDVSRVLLILVGATFHLFVVDFFSCWCWCVCNVCWFFSEMRRGFFFFFRVFFPSFSSFCPLPPQMEWRWKWALHLPHWVV